jgi:3-methyladenine DNA glycosylase AlkC
VAENPNTPVEILVKLSADGSKYVRRGVANNPNAPTSNA